MCCRNIPNSLSFRFNWPCRLISWKCHLLRIPLMQYMQLRQHVMLQMLYVSLIIQFLIFRLTHSLYTALIHCFWIVAVWSFWSFAPFSPLLWFFKPLIMRRLGVIKRYSECWSLDNILLHMNGAWLMPLIPIIKNIRKSRYVTRDLVLNNSSLLRGW